LKLLARESEKTLWKIGSSLGKSTYDPTGTATTRGMKFSSRCLISTIIGSVDCAGASFRKTTT
jgi:hypothetical protein